MRIICLQRSFNFVLEKLPAVSPSSSRCTLRLLTRVTVNRASELKWQAARTYNQKNEELSLEIEALCKIAEQRGGPNIPFLRFWEDRSREVRQLAAEVDLSKKKFFVLDRLAESNPAYLRSRAQSFDALANAASRWVTKQKENFEMAYVRNWMSFEEERILGRGGQTTLARLRRESRRVPRRETEEAATAAEEAEKRVREEAKSEPIIKSMAKMKHKRRTQS